MSAYTIQEKFFNSLEPSLVKTIKHEVQYDFFLTPQESETEMLIREVDGIKYSTSKVRRALFARNGELQRKMLELEERLAVIERGLCRGIIPND